MSIRFKFYRVCLLAVIFFILPFITSCTYKYLGPEEPENLYAPSCPGYTKEQTQFHAFSEILTALNARHWRINSVDQDKYIIVAQAKPEDWSQVKVAVQPNGLIIIQRTDPEDLWRNPYRWMHRWMKYLKNYYIKNHSCPPKDKITK